MYKWTSNNWVVMSCDLDWDLAAGDVLLFEGTTSFPVNIKKTGGGDWALNCTHHPATSSTGERVTGETKNGSKSFTITLTDIAGDCRLDCVEGIVAYALLPQQSFPGFMKRCAVKALRLGAMVLTKAADHLDERHGPTGGWTAEEGGTNATVVPYDARSYEQRRRQA